MSFNLTVVFTGLVGFVENTSDSRARMCALLINGDPTNIHANDPDATSVDGKPAQADTAPANQADPVKKSHFDGSDLRRHRAFVKFPIAAVSGLEKPSIPEVSSPDGSESFGMWYLDGCRLFFETTDAKTDPRGNDLNMHRNDFKVEKTHIPKIAQETKAEDLPLEQLISYLWILDMQRVCSFQVDSRLLARNPPRGKLAAQVLIDRGTLSTRTLTKAIWRFEPTLSTEPYEQVFAHEIMLQYQDLAAARLVAHCLDGSRRPRILDLTCLQRDGNVVIEIVNTCDDNPLGWMRADDPQRDVDNKWVYELADPVFAKLLRAKLAQDKEELPIPVPVAKLTGFGSPRGGNCIPQGLARASFYCPELDIAAPAAQHTY